MGNPNNRKGPAYISNKLIRRGSVKPPPPSVPQPPPKCTNALCSVRQEHEAKEYREGDPSTPFIVMRWRAWIHDRLSAGLPVNRSRDRQLLAEWYSVHDPTRLSSLPSGCTETSCPILIDHEAKEYHEDDLSTPHIVKTWEEWIENRLANGLPINKSRNRELLGQWYTVHNQSRLSTLAQSPAPPLCRHALCPVTDPHRKGVYMHDAEDLPALIKEKGDRVYAAWDKGIDTYHWDDHKFLDKFFGPGVHGIHIKKTAKTSA